MNFGSNNMNINERNITIINEDNVNTNEENITIINKDIMNINEGNKIINEDNMNTYEANKIINEDNMNTNEANITIINEDNVNTNEGNTDKPSEKMYDGASTQNNNEIVITLDISKTYMGILICHSNYADTTVPILAKCIKTNDIMKFWKIIKKHTPGYMVVGLSNMKDGKLTPNGVFTKNFIHQYRGQLPKFDYINEYNTTKIGKAKYPDMNENISAAYVIFNTWKNSGNNGGNST
jgi:hypothetical protein